MKILYDDQVFTFQKYGGVSRYFYELISKLQNKNNISINSSLYFSNNYYISDNKCIMHHTFFSERSFPGKNTIMLLVNKFISIFYIKKQNFDIFHPTYYDPYFLNYIEKKPFVLTVYDMIHEKLPLYFPQNNLLSNNKRLLAEKATKIIAISQSTKNDLIEIFNIDKSKIEVVYLGNSMRYNDTLELNIDIPNRYILFVGSRDIYKNFNSFVNAISDLLNEDESLSIVCAGGGTFSNKEVLLFKELKIESRIYQYDVTDKTLSFFYKKALMFVFPSLYEGFGIPILESFACECPLVCSNTSSLPEVAGDGAQYFDPNSEKSIFDAVKKVLISEEHRDVLRKNGTKILENFSWEETALKTKKIYEGILK